MFGSDDAPVSDVSVQVVDSVFEKVATGVVTAKYTAHVTTSLGYAVLEATLPSVMRGYMVQFAEVEEDARLLTDCELKDDLCLTGRELYFSNLPPGILALLERRFLAGLKYLETCCGRQDQLCVQAECHVKSQPTVSVTVTPVKGYVVDEIIAAVQRLFPAKVSKQWFFLNIFFILFGFFLIFFLFLIKNHTGGDID